MIENACNEDGDEILTLTAKSGVFKPVEVKCVQELWEQFLNLGEEKSGYYFIVYRHEGKIHGFACFGPHPLTEATFDLYWIVVDQKFHGNGIGTALLKRVEQQVKSMGGHLLVIETSGLEEYNKARRFYQTAGYQETAKIHDFYGRADDLFIYTKQI